eukprot:4474352-Amphidinium_carterae.1
MQSVVGIQQQEKLLSSQLRLALFENQVANNMPKTRKVCRDGRKQTPQQSPKVKQFPALKVTLGLQSSVCYRWSLDTWTVVVCGVLAWKEPLSSRPGISWLLAP